MTNSDSQYMSRNEVAALYDVHPNTVDRWANSGRLGDAVVITPGGQRRFRREEIRRQLAASTATRGSSPARA